MSKLLSPLRYPGGKSKAVPKILEQLPSDLGEDWEYREPFVGGGSVFLSLKRIYPNLKVWINDLNPEVYYFWKACRDCNEDLVRTIVALKRGFLSEGRGLKDFLSDSSHVENWQDALHIRAARFFILNRITFCGTTESGGFSRASFEERFTDNAIRKISDLSPLIQGIKITNLSYQPLVRLGSGRKCFLFLDPPYFSAKNGLYGKNGDMHRGFDHEELRSNLSICTHEWLITYDDSERINYLYKEFRIKPLSLNYSMSKTKTGKELFITP